MNAIIDGYTTLGAGLARDALLRQMDQAGVARAVIAPEERELAVFNAEGNDRILVEAARAGGRFIPACGATPWRGREALAILDRAAADGARLLVFAPAVQGFMMTDPVVDPLLARAGELNLPVYVQTGPHSMGAPTQTGLAAQRHAGTRFILGHCGSTDHAWDMGAIARHHLGANLYLETSLVRPWAVPRYLELAGEDRVIFGSGAPSNDPAFELAQLGSHLPVREHPGLYGENLRRLIGEVRA